MNISSQEMRISKTVKDVKNVFFLTYPLVAYIINLYLNFEVDYEDYNP